MNVQTYNVAMEFSRRDLEEKIMKKFGLDDFHFNVVESSDDNFLSLTEEHLENEALRSYVSIEVVEDDKEQLEDAAHSLICRLMEKDFVKILLLEEDRKILALG